ncbi:unnamed protein product [Effrenium voratum]|nr:unnamed protein product [Effrenium voratum]
MRWRFDAVTLFCGIVCRTLRRGAQYLNCSLSLKAANIHMAERPDWRLPMACWLILAAFGLVSGEEVQLVSGECEGQEKEVGACDKTYPCESLCQPRNCQFAQWSDWFSLGGCIGLCSRQRDVVQSNNECGRPCLGAKIETARHPDCLPTSCSIHPANCKWSTWSQWSYNEDGSKVGQSVRHRRVISEAKDGGFPCLGFWNQTRPFNKPQTTDCVFGLWSEWTPCTATCGGGTRSQHRRVAQHAAGGLPCVGALRVTESCSKYPCGEGKPPIFAPWTEWRGCGGQYPVQRFRMRKVEQAATGDYRLDPTMVAETAPCKEEAPTKCIVAPWTTWSACSATCGGQLSRTRDIDYSGSPSDCTLDLEDKSLFLKETRACGSQHCVDVVESQLSQWTEWTQCSKDCGLGTTSRSRKILREGSGGLGSGLALQEVKGCVSHHCGEVDCRWDTWEPWSACSCTCGGGTKRRSRVIAQAPRHGGQLCMSGDKSEVAPCNVQSCSKCRDGAWGAWGEWSKCTASCGGGFRVRHRDVMQRPNSCGRPAVGLEDEYHMCHDLVPCTPDQDCQLAEWAEWSACSCSCYGVKERHRRILQFAKGHGRSCGAVANAAANFEGVRRLVSMMGFSALEEVTACNPLPGGMPPVECGPLPERPCDFSPWGQWGECSASCDGGQRERARHIRTPNSHDGAPCTGPLAQIQGCGMVACEQKICKDCVWGAWSAWGDCSKCGGQRYRQRAVERMPNECGKLCDPAVAKEVGYCKSHCEDVGYCSWGEWSPLAECTATCGTAVMMRQRSLTFGHEEPKGTNELVGVGKCFNEDKLHYKSYRVKNILTEARCTMLLGTEVKDAHGVRGVQYGEAKNFCDLLVDADVDLEPNMFSIPIDLMPNIYGDTHAEGMITNSDGAMGWKCWRRMSGTFFSGERSVTCAASQVDVMECPFKSCHSCEPENCIFGEWSEWSGPSCTQLCERHRVISRMNKCGGAACDGPLVSTKHCPKECEEPQDCSFTQWMEWDSSSCRGNKGQKSRLRNILQVAVNGGRPCVGPSEETGPCGEPTDDVDCKISMWEEWQTCSKSCGAGVHRRERRIIQDKVGMGMACDGQLEEMNDCDLGQCGSGQDQDCMWGEWTQWSQGDGQGLCHRKRNIATPSNGAGSACSGAMQDVKLCHGVVDCGLTAWSEWGNCDRTCDGGQQHRGRHITQNPRNGGQACPPELEEIRGCNESPCNMQSCEVSPWKEWGFCSNSCGRGSQVRSRYIQQTASGGGIGCTNLLAESRECASSSSGTGGQCPGPADCQWSQWSHWSGCTCECDGGQRTRDRTIQQMPSPGGRACDPVNKEEIAPCNTQPCSSGACIDALWSDWSNWEACTKTCDGGITWRHRTIQRKANECGKPAIGMSMEHASCNERVACGPNVDCVFGEWQQWSGCTTPCQGIKRRSRVIAVHGKEMGRWCEGPLKQTSPCPDGPHCSGGVPVDCEVSTWHPWGACSATCGSGQKVRQRNLLQNPSNGGKYCDNNLVVTEACSTRPCLQCKPVDCIWGDWDMWGACDKCGGQRKRYRHVRVQADCGGKVCQQRYAEEISNCSRICHTPTFCAWSDWRGWGDCSVSCGPNGVRTRVRYLEAHMQTVSPYAVSKYGMNGMQGLDALEEKFHELKDRAKSVESHRMAELLAAFALGSMSFMGLVAMGQRFSRGYEDEPPFSSGARAHRYTPAPMEEE